MRVTGGWVDVYHLEDGLEYIGEPPNLARDLLYIEPSVAIILHSSVVKRLSPEQTKELKIYKFVVKTNPKDIDTHDLGELWVMPL